MGVREFTKWGKEGGKGEGGRGEEKGSRKATEVAGCAITMYLAKLCNREHSMHSKLLAKPTSKTQQQKRGKSDADRERVMHETWANKAGIAFLIPGLDMST